VPRTHLAVASRLRASAQLQRHALSLCVAALTRARRSPKAAAAARPRRAAASPAAAAGPSPAGVRKPAGAKGKGAKKGAAGDDAGPVLDSETVAALTREIICGGGIISTGPDFDDEAVEALREAAEAHVTSIFELARASAAAAGRDEPTLEDIRGVTAAMAKAVDKAVKGAK
jgi:histone H3/H4